jgi:hypothetical protein
LPACGDDPYEAGNSITSATRATLFLTLAFMRHAPQRFVPAPGTGVNR